MEKLKFGIQHPNFTYDGNAEEIPLKLSRLANEAEALGFDSFWVMDHFHQISIVGKPEEPMLEGWTSISYLSGQTKKIKLGTLVTGNTYRNPALLAKIGATLDVLSGGRLFFGIGAAWNKEEAEAYGIPFPSTRERMVRLDEAVQIVRKMWSDERTDFDGKYYKIRGAICNPKPIQKPAPKILIGGAGERVLLKIVAKRADACNLFGSPSTVKRKLAILGEHCARVGRDYDSILKTKLSRVLISQDEEAIKKRVAGVAQELLKEEYIVGTPEEIVKQLGEFRDVGIGYLILSFEPGAELESLSLFGGKVLPRL